MCIIMLYVSQVDRTCSYGAIISISFVLVQVFIEYLLLVLQSKCNLAAYL